MASAPGGSRENLKSAHRRGHPSAGIPTFLGNPHCLPCEMRPEPDKVLVIGVGREERGDDGIGREVARRLRELQLPTVRILEVGGDLTTLMEHWQGADTVILVDAVASGEEPGTVRRWALHRESLPSPLSFPVSSHGVGLAEVLELAQVLERLPPRLILYGIAGRSFAVGDGLSPEPSPGCAPGGPADCGRPRKSGPNPGPGPWFFGKKGLINEPLAKLPAFR